MGLSNQAATSSLIHLLNVTPEDLKTGSTADRKFHTAEIIPEKDVSIAISYIYNDSWM